MEVNSPFKIRDLPDNGWSVSWPGYEYNLVNNSRKAQNLLEILFEKIKVDEAQLAVRRETWSEDKSDILHVGLAAWCQDKGGLSQYLSDFIITAVKFESRDQADRFKEHLDQRLMWRRMGGTWQ